MTEHMLLGLAGIMVLGIAAQWLAWAIQIPSISLLLLIGIAAGPVTGWLHPQELFGDLLFPVVSLSVAVILFEGGLTLRTVVLRDIGKVLRNLITLGVLVTWVITTAAAYILLSFDPALAVLVGAMLVVSGPTVVGPILRHVRPVARLSSILHWEGILIDPVGVLLAVLVFEAMLIDDVQTATAFILKGMVIMTVVGSGLGFLSAKAVVYLIQRRCIPDYLHNAVTLMIVISVFTIANVLHHEAGLFAVTVMGIVMANQKAIVIKHIVEFKETLRTLLIASLFILLSARLEFSALTYVNGASLAFLGVLVLLARPAAVALSTLGSDMPWRERVFLAWMAPRGIVAAAMSSIFALRLSEAGYEQADHLVPLTFLVIIGGVIIYGLTAAPVARWLKVAQQNPQGVLFIGASRLARALAQALHAENIPVCLADTNRTNIVAARMSGLRTYYGTALSDDVLDHLDLAGIGRILALTPNDEANALATLHFTDLFGRDEAYQLVPNTVEREMDTAPHLRGRFLFDEQANYNTLSARLSAGAVVKTTSLSEQFDYDAFQAFYQGAALPLFTITASGNLRIWAADNRMKPEPGHRLISLIPADVPAVATPDAAPAPPNPAPVVG